MDDRLRLLLWHWGRRGGGPRYTMELARALAGREDLELHLSLSRQSELFAETASLGSPSYHIDTYESLSAFAYRSAQLPMIRRRFARYLRDSRIDVVLCTMDHLWNAFVAPAIRRCGASYLLTVHDAERHPGEDLRVRQWLLRRDIALADGALTLTNAVRERLAARYGFPEQRIWVAPHGSFGDGSEAHPRTLPVGRPLRLLFFGRILPYKGLELLLDAYARIRQGGSPVTLEIWGQGDLSPYRAKLSALPDVTVVNRWIDEAEIGDILRHADLCVLPYREASQSGVVAASVATGLPVVATPVGGLREQVPDGIAGVVAQAVTADAVAEAILMVIGDPSRYAALSRGALEMAASELNWERIAGKVSDAVHGLHGLGRR